MTSLELGTKFDTRNVTNMNHMFDSCGTDLLTSLNLGTKFDTRNVTNMNGMFTSCGVNAMTSLNLGTYFDTSNVTNMYGMFASCGYQEMTSLNLGEKFDTSKVTNMSYMFSGCGYEKLATINLGNKFDTGNVTNMSSMFLSFGYKKLTSLNLGERFNTSKVTNMNKMFSKCGYTSMVSIDLGNNFDTSKVVDMSYMFSDCGYKSLLSLDLGSKFDTSSVTNMRLMFDSCGNQSLTNFNLGSKFDTSNVTNMAGMFQTFANNITTIDLGNLFNTSKVTDMSSMFNQCGKTSLTQINLGELFDTSNVVDMGHMFKTCGSSNMKVLDLGDKFDTSKVEDMELMFYNCKYIEKIYAPTSFVTTSVTNSDKMFLSCTSIIGGNGTVYDASHIDKEYAWIDGRVDPATGVSRPGYFWCHDEYPVIYNANAGSATVTNMPANQTKNFGEPLTLSSNVPARTDYIFKGWSTDRYATVAEYPAGGTYTANAGVTLYAVWMPEWAQYLPGVQFNAALKRLAGNASATNSTEDSSIKSIQWQSGIINVSQVPANAQNVGVTTGAPIYAWFEEDAAANDGTGTIKLWSEATTIMLNDDSSCLCKNMNNIETVDPLIDLGVTEGTTNVIYMSNMFSGTGYDIQTFNLNLSEWDTSNVTSMSSMFAYSGFHSTTWNIGNLENWDTSKVTNMDQMFLNAAYSASTVNAFGLSNWNTANVKSMNGMFHQFGYNATSWNIGDLSNWDTSSVTNMNGMFYLAGRNSTIWNIGNISNWNTSNVITLQSMFKGAGSRATTWFIGSLNNWNTSNVTNMNQLFDSAGSNCSEINLDLSSWDTSSVTNMNNMFADAWANATTWNIGDLSRWDTSSATSMVGMFLEAGGNSTTWNIGDISNWDTSKVTSMNGMFREVANNTTSLVLDLSGWDTSSVTNMGTMFYRAKKISKIYVSERFVTTAVTSSTNMFDGATQIIGGNGTTYSSSHIDKEYAWIDGTVDPSTGLERPGYFWCHDEYPITYNANAGTSTVTNIPATQTKNYGEPLTLSSNIPVRNGFVFKGWATSASAETAEYAAGGIYTKNAPATLYAVWGSNLTITYVATNGGTLGSFAPTATVAPGATYTIPNQTLESPLSMHSFAGWTTIEENSVESESGEIVEYAPGASFTVNDDMTLYAVYTSDLIESVANAPRLGAGMKAVWWTDENDPLNSEVTGASYPAGTYSYNSVGHDVRDEKQSKWANAITEEDHSYWVWIPRYAYKIHSFDNTTAGNKRLYSAETTDHDMNYNGQIEILFLNGTSNKYLGTDGELHDLPAGYIVHPAFQTMTAEEESYGKNPLGKWDAELEGIWVAKYEMAQEKSTDGGNTWTNVNTTLATLGDILTTKAGNTSTTTQYRVVSKPSVYSWRNIKETFTFTNLQKMNPNLNTHQIKNSEWGAVAYLTQSTYGRNGERVAVNQNTQYVTGSGKGAGSSTIYNGTYSSTSANINSSNYAWFKELGKLTSTTGNVYGLYDTAGGSSERVASYINNGHSNLAEIINYGIEPRLKQVYESAVSDGSDSRLADYNLAMANGIVGDSTWEVSRVANSNSAWPDKVAAYFPTYNKPFFSRGGIASGNGYMSSVLSYNDAYVGVDNTYSSRPVLIVDGRVSLIFDGNGSDISTIAELKPQRGEAGSTFTIPSIDKTQIDSSISLHSFAGWSTTKTVEGEDSEIVEYYPGDTITINESTTLYAVYKFDQPESVANAPVLGDGMKAVWWTDESDPDNSEVVADSYAEGTYSYNATGHDVRNEMTSKWANAITEEDHSYWVWIPRYAYKIHSFKTTNESRLYKDEIDLYADHSNNKSGHIEVVFLNGTTNKYLGIDGELHDLPADYIVHPAFQKMTAEEESGGTNPLGKWDAEIEGIWIAKYEMSQEKSTDGGNTWINNEATSTLGNILTTKAGNPSTTEQYRVVSKPNVRSWNNIVNTTSFYNLKNMYMNLNSHMMKNSEWGAMAYLTYSTYGRNGNKLSSNQSRYTGRYGYEGDSWYWYSSKGKQTSSTGNIYGIYDTYGCHFEYVASYRGVDNNYPECQALVQETDLKYKQVYENGYGIDNIYGDAVYETSYNGVHNGYSWRGGQSSFPQNNGDIFTRDWETGGADLGGIFSFSSLGRTVNATRAWFSSRPVLVVGGNQSTIVYEANAGSDIVSNMPSPQTKQDGFSINLSIQVPTRTGYTFYGWADSATSTKAEYQPGDRYSKNGDATLYAFWMPDEHVTYNAANTEFGTGTFTNGTSQNLVAYENTTQIVTKYSHTANINDAGTQNGSYANNLATKEVISIPGSSSLHITVTYGTENNYDMLYIFQGEYTGSVTRNMSAGQLYKLMGGSNTTTTVEYDIPGDTATFAFYSDSSTTYYGYYAVITNGVKVLAGEYEEPTLSNMNFAGWADANNATTPAYNNEAEVVNAKAPDGTVYAVYGYRVEYDLNGGTSTAIPSQTKLKNVDLTLSSKTPTRTGYTFKGWDENPNQNPDTPTYVGTSATYTNNANAKLYAIWKQNLYNVTYNANAGSDTVTNMPENQIKYGGQTLVLASEVPVRGDYTFLGWGTSSTATSVSYRPGANYTSNSALNLYAIWAHVVTYDANGGTGAPTSQNKLAGRDLTLSTTIPTKDGLTFAGWAEDSSSSTIVAHQPGEVYTEERDLNLFAVYGATITLDPNGGELGNVPSEVAKINGVDLILPYDVPTREGYAFQGWATSSTATTATYQAGGTYTQEGANTLYAVWDNNFTITYNSPNYAFNNSTTTNVVSYAVPTSSTPTITTTKYSHTANIDNTGTATGTYANNLNTNEVITIPGATSLHVKLYYSTESTSYDWVCVWAGSHPEYTAASNYSSSKLGTKTSKIGGGQKTTFGDATLIEGDIEGDSVTFGFKSDGSTAYYGYYAVITGEGCSVNDLRISGTYKEPVVPNGYRFLGWSTNPNATTAMFTTEEQIVLSKPANMTLYAVVKELIAQYVSGEKFDYVIKRLGGTTTVYGDTYNTTITTIELSDTAPSITGAIVDGNGMYSNISASSIVNVSCGDEPIYAWCEGETIKLYSEAGKISLNNDCKKMFYNLRALTQLNPITSLGVTEETRNVTTMESMFEECKNLTNLDLTNNKFNTSNVTTMANLFYGCSSLTNIDLTHANFDTSKVTNMSRMFAFCNSLTSLDLTHSNFDTSNVTNMSEMFWCCNRLTSLDLTHSNFDTSNVTNMGGMFESCYRLGSIDLTHDNFNTSNVTNMSSMFAFCELTSIDLSHPNFDTSNVTDMNAMFCSNKFTRLDFTTPNFDTSNVTNMASMFSGCTVLTSINFGDYFDTGKVTNMSCMFGTCFKLPNIDLTGFDTHSLKDTEIMFAHCSALTNIAGINELGMHGLQNIAGMFWYCNSLTRLDLSLWDVSSVESFLSESTTPNSGLFENCYDLKEIDISGWDTSSVTNMSNMFYNCSSLQKVYTTSSFDTSNVTSMSCMFYHAGYRVTTSLNMMDFSSWDTSKVTNMVWMFREAGYNSSTFVLDLSSWNVSSVIYMTNMFTLAGRSATTFKLKMSGWDTSSLQSIEGMFSSAGSGATTFNLDVSGWNTSNVEDMCGAFSSAGASASYVLDLSDWDTSSVTDMRNMFYNCTRLTKIYVSSSFVTTSVTKSENMFKDCNNLMGGNGTAYNSSHVDKEYARIDGGTSNPGYFTRKP